MFKKCFTFTLVSIFSFQTLAVEARLKSNLNDKLKAVALVLNQLRDYESLIHFVDLTMGQKEGADIRSFLARHNVSLKERLPGVSAKNNSLRIEGSDAAIIFMSETRLSFKGTEWSLNPKKTTKENLQEIHQIIKDKEQTKNFHELFIEKAQASLIALTVFIAFAAWIASWMVGITFGQAVATLIIAVIILAIARTADANESPDFPKDITCDDGPNALHKVSMQNSKSSYQLELGYKDSKPHEVTIIKGGKRNTLKIHSGKNGVNLIGDSTKSFSKQESDIFNMGIKILDEACLPENRQKFQKEFAALGKKLQSGEIKLDPTAAITRPLVPRATGGNF